jgi:Ca2+-binding RTX toxin-like protein
MANYFNNVGSSIVTGAKEKDQFYAFTRLANLDYVRPDAILAQLFWNSAILTSAGTSYQVVAVNVQISMDLFLGAEANDVIYGSNLADALFYNNGAIANGFGGFDNIEQFWLGDGDDVIDLSAQGPGGKDYLKDVLVQGQGGNDIIIGGAGKDNLQGDAGNDIIFGWRGTDQIYGGLGDDLLYGDDLGFNDIGGDDVIEGGAGQDTLYGGRGNDKLSGGDDNDLLHGQAGGDNLSGGNGDDTLHGDDAGSISADTLNGNAGQDRLFGGGGNDELYGGTGNDILDAGDGSDYVHGGSGDDTIIAGAGDDVIDGSGDVDTLVFAGNRSEYLVTLQSDGSYVSLDQRTGSPEGKKSISNIEYFRFADLTVAAGGLNYAPVITSNGGGASAAVSIPENGTAVTTVTATDPDAGQTISFAIAGGADAALFAIDGLTGELRFVRPPDFESPADANSDNVYTVTVAASDGAGGVALQNLSVSVLDVTDGLAPVITSNGGGATASVTLAENKMAVTVVTASDPDSPTVSYAIVGGEDAGAFTIDPATGELRFTTPPDFERPTDVDGDNTYRVVVAASDGSNIARQSLTIAIANLNDNIPILTSYGGATSVMLNVAENSLLAAGVAASDADGTALTYTISGGADAALFSIAPLTGALSFLAAPDYEAPSDSDGNRIYQVTVQGTDGLNSVSQAFAITVTNANDNAPVISSNGGSSAATVAVAENSSVVTTVIASDADGTAPSFLVGGGADAALFKIDPATGLLTFITAPDYENAQDADGDGTYQVTVRAFDGANVDEQQLSIIVTDVNESGKVINGSSGNNTIAPASSTLAYQTTALNDVIYGRAGNDVIDGGAGADYMAGGAGNDSFYVETYSDNGFAADDDQVVELAGEGTDIVYASVSYRLADEVEKLTLTGSAAIDGAGNTLSNAMNGNDAANTLDGGSGDDELFGWAGDDLLIGGLGNDLLNGGTGADHLAGGLGDDVYVVDRWSDDGSAANDDNVLEVAGEGVDQVNSSVTYRLSVEVEKLTLTGTDAIDGIGNDLANTLIGNGSANQLWGGLGNDVLQGNGGNDRLFAEDGLDNIDGGVGDDWLDGGAGVDTLLGRAGDDTLVGGLGKDTLTGGTGADIFAFRAGDTTLNSASHDRIADFSLIDGDRIDLTFLDGSLPVGRYAEASISSSNFTDARTAAASLVTGPNQVAFIAGATDGWVFYDENGDGALDQSIVLTGARTLSGVDASSFI